MKLTYKVFLLDDLYESFIECLRIPEVNHGIDFSFGFDLRLTIHRVFDTVQMTIQGNSDETMSEWKETIFLSINQMEDFIRKLSTNQTFKIPGFTFWIKDDFDSGKELFILIETDYLNS